MNMTPDPEETEREAIATLIQECFPTGAGGYSVIWEDCLPAADAILAARRLSDSEMRREEFGITAAHLTRQREFSQKTFGPGPRLAGVLDHIRKELAEVEAEPQDMSEWADVVILAFDGALRQGHNPQALLDAILAKQKRNEGREWPDWRTQPTDRAIEHIRAGKESNRG